MSQERTGASSEPYSIPQNHDVVVKNGMNNGGLRMCHWTFVMRRYAKTDLTRRAFLLSLQLNNPSPALFFERSAPK